VEVGGGVVGERMEGVGMGMGMHSEAEESLRARNAVRVRAMREARRVRWVGTSGAGKSGSLVVEEMEERGLVSVSVSVLEDSVVSGEEVGEKVVGFWERERDASHLRWVAVRGLRTRWERAVLKVAWRQGMGRVAGETGVGELSGVAEVVDVSESLDGRESDCEVEVADLR
jgi:hypothetical protein